MFSVCLLTLDTSNIITHAVQYELHIFIRDAVQIFWMKVSEKENTFSAEMEKKIKYA